MELTQFLCGWRSCWTASIVSWAQIRYVNSRAGNIKTSDGSYMTCCGLPGGLHPAHSGLVFRGLRPRVHATGKCSLVHLINPHLHLVIAVCGWHFTHFCPVSRWEGVGLLVHGDTRRRTAYPQTVPALWGNSSSCWAHDSSVSCSHQSTSQSRGEQHQDICRAEPWNSRGVWVLQREFSHLLLWRKGFCPSRWACPPYWLLVVFSSHLSRRQLRLSGSVHQSNDIAFPFPISLIHPNHQ